MTENLTDIENRWTERQLPFVEDPAPIISAWTTDEEIAAQSREFEPVYGDRYATDTLLRLFRSQLRSAAMATASAADTAVLIQSVLDAGVDELVTADMSDADLDVLVTAAEAGYGSAIPGLRRQLGYLRDAEREDAA
ncbi:Uncharacterised protein [Mycobacteroides abscessus subsp. abscessus]|uniref:hypothetical protein n=1 Tax=Mycobacteroides abscessus TaxID=36809 RepID=UPI0009A79B37|nr:hypothetical protein [Mycobacteroides abscessus]SKM35504.1 Uncharacterised protein [Mycobacteroides abscessus subsp. abscessus]